MLACDVPLAYLAMVCDHNLLATCFLPSGIKFSPAERMVNISSDCKRNEATSDTGCRYDALLIFSVKWNIRAILLRCQKALASTLDIKQKTSALHDLSTARLPAANDQVDQLSPDCHTCTYTATATAFKALLYAPGHKSL